MKPWRLKGHSAALTFCIASRSRPAVIASAGSSSDAKTSSSPSTRPRSRSPLCFKSGNEDVVYASSGAQISCFHVHMTSSMWKPSETYNYNKDEIN